MANAKCHTQLHLMEKELYCVDLNVSDMSKFSVAMAIQGIMIDLQQNAGFFTAAFWYLLRIRDNVVYVCDTQTSCIKISTTLKKTAEFLKGIGELFSAFSLHEKHQTYESCDLPGAIVRVGRCLQVLEENVLSIRRLNCRLPHKWPRRKCGSEDGRLSD